MLSKFKKLFRASRTLSPIKEKDIPSDKLTESPSTKDKKGKEKGKNKRNNEDVGDVVETQSQCPPSDEVDIVENEFVEKNTEDVKYPLNNLKKKSINIFHFPFFMFICNVRGYMHKLISLHLFSYLLNYSPFLIFYYNYSHFTHTFVGM